MSADRRNGAHLRLDEQACLEHRGHLDDALASQHELLLQIIERPDDDQLRMVLADRLNDVGDPLGELILVQCAIERLIEGKGAGDWNALKTRELELVRAHGAKWHEAAAPFARRLIFKRGLPYKLETSANALLDDGGLTVLDVEEVFFLVQFTRVELGFVVHVALVSHVSSSSRRQGGLSAAGIMAHPGTVRDDRPEVAVSPPRMRA